MTFQIARYIRNFFITSVFFDLHKKDIKKSTYWLSKDKYNYQNNLANVNNNTSNYRPTGQEKFQIKVQKGNENAIQQHFNPSVVQTWGTWGIITHAVSITRFINATSRSHSLMWSFNDQFNQDIHN